VKFKVKIPFQAHIVHNQAKPKPVPTGKFKEKLKSVPTSVRVIEVNTGSFLQQMKMERSRRITWLVSLTSGKGRI
jgi:hypothetical protein